MAVTFTVVVTLVLVALIENIWVVGSNAIHEGRSFYPFSYAENVKESYAAKSSSKKFAETSRDVCS